MDCLKDGTASIVILSDKRVIILILKSKYKLEAI